MKDATTYSIASPFPAQKQILNVPPDSPLYSIWARIYLQYSYSFLFLIEKSDFHDRTITDKREHERKHTSQKIDFVVTKAKHTNFFDFCFVFRMCFAFFTTKPIVRLAVAVFFSYSLMSVMVRSDNPVLGDFLCS